MNLKNLDLVREIESIQDELESLRGLILHGRRTGQADGQWMENLVHEELMLESFEQKLLCEQQPEICE